MRRFRLISRENANPADVAVTQCRGMHYCIARDGELWFERLDFDAF